MEVSYERLLRSELDDHNYSKLMQVESPTLHQFVADAIELCEPSSVFVCTDSPQDIAHIRKGAIEAGEEVPLAMEGHTVHFDGYHDLGRDREATKYLVPKADSLSKTLNQIDREEGLAEMRSLLKASMKGRTMIVRFLSLGPTNSIFSIPCVQCTDSFYVAHSEDLLYRSGFEEFKRLGNTSDFFRILHSAGKLNEDMTSADVDKRRIYIDHSYDTIYSVNTQYAGNTVGLKKLALRLTIRKADREGWLAEHMMLVGVHGPGSRKTYIAGAFPSACGKTSTAMLPGATILGDDIAYFRNIDGEARAVNAENGIFGIIQNVNPEDDPVIYEVLTSPGEVIFSNVLVRDGTPYWLGMGCKLPTDGENASGPWDSGKTDEEGNAISAAAKNARYTVCLGALANTDPELDSPLGVPLAGIMYGGRDFNISVPVRQSFDWNHGIVTCGASLESVTTYATVGREGILEINLMSIQDFVAIPLGKYIQSNLDFGKGLKKQPLIFGVNYFLCDKEGNYANEVRDKAVWVKWMELRIHGDVGAFEGPTGWIPKYEDLKPLFRQVRGKDYTEKHYVEQFTIRIPENLKKMDRVEEFSRNEVGDTPPVLFDILSEECRRLLRSKERWGEYVSPFELGKSNS